MTKGVMSLPIKKPQDVEVLYDRCGQPMYSIDYRLPRVVTLTNVGGLPKRLTADATVFARKLGELLADGRLAVTDAASMLSLRNIFTDAKVLFAESKRFEQPDTNNMRHCAALNTAIEMALESRVHSRVYIGWQQALAILVALEERLRGRKGYTHRWQVPRRLSDVRPDYTYNWSGGFCGTYDIQVLSPFDQSMIFVQKHLGGDARNVGSGWFHADTSYTHAESDLLDLADEYVDSSSVMFEVPNRFPLWSFFDVSGSGINGIAQDDDDTLLFTVEKPEFAYRRTAGCQLVGFVIEPGAEAAVHGSGIFGGLTAELDIVKSGNHNLWKWVPRGYRVPIERLDFAGKKTTAWHSTQGYFKWTGPAYDTPDWHAMLQILSLGGAHAVDQTFDTKYIKYAATEVTT